GHPHHRADGARHVRRPGARSPGRLRRLRYQADRASPAAGEDRIAACPRMRSMIPEQTHEEAARSQRVHLSYLRHELRTPLNAIIGYSEMLLEDLGAEEEVAPDLWRI